MDFCSFSVHAIQMGEKVTGVFGHALNVLGRIDDVSGYRYFGYYVRTLHLVIQLC